MEESAEGGEAYDEESPWDMITEQVLDFMTDAFKSVTPAVQLADMPSAGEQTFAVQYKTASVRTVPSKEDPAFFPWLRDLNIPYFIGSVDRKNDIIEVYTVLAALAHLNARMWGTVTLHLDRPDPPPGRDYP